MKEIDANTYSGALTLRALYVIAHRIIHADGVVAEEERQVLIDLIREILGNPDFEAGYIIWQLEEHADRPLPAEAVAKLSFAYRITLLDCAFLIANSDRNIAMEESDLLDDLADILGMPKDWRKRYRSDDGEPEGKMLAGDSSKSLMTWARDIIGVEAKADSETVVKAVNSQLEQCDTSTNDGLEKHKALHDAAAVLLGGRRPADDEDDERDLPIGF